MTIEFHNYKMAIINMSTNVVKNMKNKDWRHA
jgi:hypothetical protein